MQIYANNGFNEQTLSDKIDIIFGTGSAAAVDLGEGLFYESNRPKVTFSFITRYNGQTVASNPKLLTNLKFIEVYRQQFVDKLNEKNKEL